MLNKLNISNSKKKLIIYIVLTTVTLAVFWQVNQFDFINFDDPVYITENSYVKSGLTLEGVRWAFSSKYFGLWNPLVWLSFMLDYQFHGLNPGSYHLTNIILHILSTLLLFWLFCRMTGAIWKSAFVAAVFALHPLHVESVAWIAERKDVLSAFFWMLTLCLYVYYTEKPLLKRYLLVLSSFVFALLSKPMVVTLPVIMILLDYWPLKRFESRTDNWLLWQLKEKLPFFVLSALLIIITFYTPDEQEINIKSFPPSARLANAPVAFVTYLGKTFWPHDLAVFYPFPSQIPIWQVMGNTFLIIVISAIVIVLVKRLPYLFTGWLWFAITIAPVTGIKQIGDFAMTDRYHYLPSIGIAIMLAWGVPLLFPGKKTRKNILFPMAIALLSFLTFFTWKQCGYWKNSSILFSHALQATKNNYLAHNNLGLALFAEGKTEEAVTHYNEVIRIRPSDVLPYHNKAIVYAKLGQYQLAIENYNDAIRIKPDNADSYNSRGTIYAKLSQYQPAIKDFTKAISLKPDFADAYYNRGTVYHNLGQQRSALDDFTRAINLKPDNISAYFNRGNIYINLGQYQLAIDDFNKAIILDHASVYLYNNRGFIYLMLGQYKEAVEDYSKAISLKPDYADAYNNRAFVYLNLGNIQIGCSDAKKACELGNCATLQNASGKGLCR
jgi:protein O-mannosyl-transferase